MGVAGASSLQKSGASAQVLFCCLVPWNPRCLAWEGLGSRKDTGPKDQSAAWLCGKPEKGGFLAYSLGTTSGFGTFSHCPTHSPVTCAALWYFYARPMAGLWPVDLAWLKCGMYRPDPTERPCLSRCLGTAGQPGTTAAHTGWFCGQKSREDL